MHKNVIVKNKRNINNSKKKRVENNYQERERERACVCVYVCVCWEGGVLAESGGNGCMSLPTLAGQSRRR